VISVLGAYSAYGKLKQSGKPGQSKIEITFS
jgi:hypothetical protein